MYEPTSTTVAEYACQITWPDGHVEITDPATRRAAEVAAERWATDGKVTYVLRRAVTTTAWEQVPNPKPVVLTFDLDPLRDGDGDDPTVVTAASQFQAPR
jgi:hypothetical protein